MDEFYEGEEEESDLSGDEEPLQMPAALALPLALPPPSRRAPPASPSRPAEPAQPAEPTVPLRLRSVHVPVSYCPQGHELVHSPPTAPSSAGRGRVYVYTSRCDRCGDRVQEATWRCSLCDWKLCSSRFPSAFHAVLETEGALVGS